MPRSGSPGQGKASSSPDTWREGRSRDAWRTFTMGRPSRLLALALAAPLLLAGCTTDGGGGSDGGGAGGTASEGGGDLTFSVITHGSAGDAFWDVVQNG